MLERILIDELTNEGYEPECIGGLNNGRIDIKVDVDGTNFIIQSKNWRKSICMVGMKVAPNTNCYFIITKDMARTSPFQIILATCANLIRDLRVTATGWWQKGLIMRI
ncbi:2799_t:CDS:2 [Funneliformis geosporum]|nr:2799_t:CDS:2 [Funneliformis geosporum]